MGMELVNRNDYYKQGSDAGVGVGFTGISTVPC